MDIQKFRDRKFRLVLYPDDPTHAACVDKLMASGYQFAGILHKNDVWEDGESDNHNAGEIKKPHWHIVLKFPNAKWNNALAAELGIAPNYIMSCTNFDGALKYLVHEGYPEKYQYDVDDVFGPLKPNVAKLLCDKDEGSKVLEIVHIIDSSPGRCTYREILVKACNNGMYDVFRRLGSGVKYLINEHNDEFYSSKYADDTNALDRMRFASGLSEPGHGSKDWVARCDMPYVPVLSLDE